MSNRALHIAVDIGSDRVTAAGGRPGRNEPARALRLGHHTDAASAAVFVVADGFLHGDAAARRSVGSPRGVLRDYTRRIGDDVPMTIAGRAVRAEDAYAGVVEWALGAAVDTFGHEPAAVTTVVPAAWGPHRRTRLAAALDASGMPSSLLSAPDAAASFRMNATGGADEVFAVYDLGADSCDVALVRIRAGEAHVLAAASLTDIGGADFDDAVLAHVLAFVPAARDTGPLALAALRRECVAAKEALSFDTETVIPVVFAGGEHVVRLVRDEFEALIEDDVRATIAAVSALCTDAGVAVADLSCVLAFGGSSRIPRVLQLLSEHLAIPVATDPDPQSVLVRGAAASPVPDARREPVPAAATGDVTAEAPDPPFATGPTRAVRRAGWAVLGAVMQALTPTPLPPREPEPGRDPRTAAETPDGAREELPPTPALAPRMSAIPSGTSDTPQTSPPPSSPIVTIPARSRKHSRAGV
ncbi:Hsp70 family protein [Microbacterium sp. 179-B 1A2 NHS]|uniref:Hsp70 family protein n=1 Tax=Microbacterium sp. 179-B 1A2 NHS TaxID=3142383 RepID=UPI0039A2CECC